jgi:SNF2 family DNA or RNA helicase
MPHQWYGACYGAAVKRWFLGDVPGAGKTRTSVAWATLVGARKIVLVAEANVCNQFAGEFMTLEPTRKIITLAGLDRDTRHKHLNDMLRSDNGVVVINYEMFRRDKEALGKIQMWQPDTVIVDEAHNMKNIKTANYKYVEQIIFANNTCPDCGGLVYGVARPCGSCGWRIPPVRSDCVRLLWTRRSSSAPSL